MLALTPASSISVARATRLMVAELVVGTVRLPARIYLWGDSGFISELEPVMERYKRLARHKRLSLERLISRIETFGGRNWKWLLPLMTLLLVVLLMAL